MRTTKEQREEIKRDADTLATIAKREFLLRRVLASGRGGTAEREELKAILAQRGAIYTKIGYSKIGFDR